MLYHAKTLATLTYERPRFESFWAAVDDYWDSNLCQNRLEMARVNGGEGEAETRISARGPLGSKMCHCWMIDQN